MFADILLSNDEDVQGSYNNKYRSDVAKIPLYRTLPNDPLRLNKQWVESQFWGALANLYGVRKAGFFGQEMLPPQHSYDEQKYKLTYTDTTTYSWFLLNIREAIHIGQRKLLLTEIHALVKLLDRYDEEAIVIYAGSAPSNKLWLLLQLFPRVKFILVDPNEFYIYWGEYDKPHYILASQHNNNKKPYNINNKNYNSVVNRQDDWVVYLSYSNSNMYNSANPAWSSKSIVYYDAVAKKLVGIKDKCGRTDIRNVGQVRNKNTRKQIFAVTSGLASEESFKYALASDHRVYLCEEYFTDATANKIAAALSDYKGKVLFESDIRTNTGNTGMPDDLDVVWNNVMTYSWLRILKPDLAMVKHRLPFYINADMNVDFYRSDFDIARELGHDFAASLADTENMYFFPGEVFYQPWQPPRSTESRLFIKKADIVANNIVKWNLSLYEDKCFFYNCIERCGLLHINNNACAEIGFDHCNDCASENLIWCQYNNKYGGRINVLEWVKLVSKILNVPLLMRKGLYGHGYLFPGLVELDIAAITNGRIPRGYKQD
jgi:hypothetical protein